MIEMEQVEAALPGFCLSSAENKDYQTLASFVVKQLGRVPQGGETFEAQGYIFEELDVDRHSVDKLLVMPASSSNASGHR